MEPKRLTGPLAGSMKYDILTALAVSGLHGSPKEQASMLRLSTLLTARYNWRRDEFCVGQREMARLWNVSERTVKREIKTWVDGSLLICKRPGVRGRVGAYRLNLPEVFRRTKDTWNHVGPDFSDRMSEMSPDGNNVIPLRTQSKNTDHAALETVSGIWGPVQERLQALYPDKYATWLHPLKFAGDDGQVLSLVASSSFVARYVETHFLTLISEAVEVQIGPGRRIVIRAN